MKQIGRVVLLFQARLCLFTTQTRAETIEATISCICRNCTGFTPNKTYQSNLKILFSSLASNATNNPTGFHTSSAGIKPPDVVYGAFLCRGDVSIENCSECVSKAIKVALERCPQSNDVMVWLDECMLRYAPQPLFLGDADPSFSETIQNGNNVSDPNRFEDILRKTLNDIAARASTGDRSGKRFAVGEANFSALQTLYALAQCTPDLNC